MAIYSLGETTPVRGQNVFIADTAAVIGDVGLGEQSSVWFGAVLRGDVFPISVGARTNIQDNAILHVTSGRAATHIGDDVTIGHGAILHGCTIGTRCLIGMGSIVLDGAVVGDECFVAAGSLIAPAAVIPPRSFVLGRPGRVVRSVGDAELAMIEESARNYVRYAGDFQSRCKKMCES